MVGVPRELVALVLRALNKSLHAEAGDTPTLVCMVWGEPLTCLSLSFLFAVSHSCESIQGNTEHTKESQMLSQLGLQAPGL